MKKVLISGGTGLIGKQLASLLLQHGYEVRLLSRSPKSNASYPTYSWNIEKATIDEKAFENLDYIIHLAGAGIADKRWTKKQKKEIIDSRVASTELLLKTIQRLQIPLKAFVSSSAIGYYGAATNDLIFRESDNPGNDFISHVCQLWEESIFKFQAKNIRTVAVRIGVVLSKSGGALSKMKTPIITPLGNGKQYMPWIHIDDLCKLLLKAIEDNAMTGVYNGVAPEHQTNFSFSKTFAKAIKRPFLPIGIPAFVLKLVLGEMSVILLKGSKVSSQKLSDTGFSFSFPYVKSAFSDLF